MPEESFYFKDFRFLVDIQQNPVPLDLRIDLCSTWQELKEQYKQAKELDVSWLRHLITTTCSDAHPGELVLLTNAFLRTAITTRDSLLRLAQRFVLLDGIYLTLCQVGKFTQQAQEKWEREKAEKRIDTSSVIVKTDKTVLRIESIIAEIEFEISEAKKSLHEGKCHLQKPSASDVCERSCVKPEEEEEVKDFEMVEVEDDPGDHNMEIEAQDGPDRFTEEQPEKRQESSIAQELSDEDYLFQLIRENSGEEEEQEINTQKCENSGENEEQEINSQESSHDDYQQKRSIQDIGKDLDDLERGLRLLPTRRITEKLHQIMLSCSIAA
ncbi:hypothetical protein OSTOST_20735 [Ostertagia ostertagi]